MELGVHLPLIDFGGGCMSAHGLRDYVLAARDTGFGTVAANDHLLWPQPWLDGPSALAAVTPFAGDLTLATTVALPTLRHPVVLAKTVTTLATLHAGPLIVGIGPGSSRADYDAVGVPFDQRWARFDDAARQLRALLRPDAAPAALRPLPDPPLPIWFASWGSPARLRAAAHADGWIASGHHTGAQQYAPARAELDEQLAAVGRDPATFPDMVATVWFHVTDSAANARRVLHDVLAPTLSRDPDELARHLPVGPPEHCVRVLADYAAAGARRVLLWPVEDPIGQLHRFAEDITPHLPAPSTPPDAARTS